jgi:DNA-binding response OmpR family regulator
MNLAAAPTCTDPRGTPALLNGRPLALAPRELALLACLAAEPGRVFTKRELLGACWGARELGPASRALDVAVARLRRRLGPDAPLLVTVWGVGYRFSAPAVVGQPRAPSTPRRF